MIKIRQVVAAAVQVVHRVVAHAAVVADAAEVIKHERKHLKKYVMTTHSVSKIITSNYRSFVS